MAAGRCIIVLGKDEITHTDETTERLVPEDAVIRINRNKTVNDLAENIIDLIENLEKIAVYSERMKGFAKDFLWSWDERVNYEIELLQKVARNESIEDRCLVKPNT
jgi:hypothetical protein